MDSYTGSLFSEEPVHSQSSNDFAGLSWSYSRRETLEQCTRRYFFQYYSGALTDADLKSRAHFLRSVKNRHLRIGELVHLVIGTYLKKLKVGKSLSADWLVRWARELFQKDLDYSVHIREGGTPLKVQFPPALLDEVLNYREGHSALLSQSEAQMVASIQNFFAPAFSELRALGELTNSHIERKFSLAGFPARVTGKVDLAVYNSGVATVVDWKTGLLSDGGAESLQLATYGIWARGEFHTAEGSLRVAKGYLVSKQISNFDAESGALQNARVRILQDLERMVVLHRYGKLGGMDAFTPNPHAGTCLLCAFREVCPEGRAIIDA